MGSRSRTVAGMIVLGAWLAAAGPSLAQQSTSYRLDEHVLNSGGSPSNGTVLSSPGFRMSLSSIGEGVVGTGMASASYRAVASFLSAYPPPGEVTGLLFTDAQTLAWDGERSVGTYAVYRDGIAGLTGGGYGTCLVQDLVTPTAIDATTPGAGQGFFYLVTAENRLFEEGTKGADSGGADRGGTVCP